MSEVVFCCLPHRQLWMSNLSKVATQGIEVDSNPRPSGCKAQNIPLYHCVPNHYESIINYHSSIIPREIVCVETKQTNNTHDLVFAFFTFSVFSLFKISFSAYSLFVQVWPSDSALCGDIKEEVIPYVSSFLINLFKHWWLAATASKFC